MADMKSPGDWIWVPDPDDCFIPACVVAAFRPGEKGEAKAEDGRILKLTAEQTKACLNMDAMSRQDIENMVLFNDLNEASLLHNVRKRYNLDKIYTSVGDILVSVNPFKALPIYDERTLTSYMSAQGRGLAPHIFTVADLAYRSMISDRQSQAVCIAGESGAGKTEAMKSVLRYLAEVSSRTTSGAKTQDADKKHSLEQQILQTNPVTESFGNAKTLRNNNSSRFGKWTALRFTPTGNILGAFITDYLLEKSRVTFQSGGERNYHSFYQLIAGAAERPQLRESLKIEGAEDFNYLLGGGGAGAAGGGRVVECDGMSDSAEFDALVEAFNILGKDAEQQNAVFRMLAAVLHLGNIRWNTDDDGLSDDMLRVETQDVLEHVCTLLGVEKARLETALVSRNIGRASVIAVPYTQTQAAQARDAFAKALYGALFKWLIGGINASLSKQIAGSVSTDPDDTMMIGVLDIFGFETFEVNSFEQLCINYCNEKLQYHFNNHIFAVEARAYEAEGVSVTEIDFDNNESTLELLEGQNGLIAMMDEEILVPKGSDEGFLSKTISRHERQPRYVRVVKQRSVFGVRHYAGVVNYTVTDFLEKNKDTLQSDFVSLTRKSSDSFVAGMFAADDADASGGGEGRRGRRARGRQQKHKTTLATHFKQQLGSLVEIMEQCAPQFVRCVKPNDLKVGNMFQSAMVLRQLRCAGLLEVCRVRKLGYPCRFEFKAFVQRYFSISPADQGEIRGFCKALEHKGALHSGQYQVGHTKVFMRVPCQNAVEAARRAALFNHVASIQRIGRGHGCRSVYARWREHLANVSRAVDSCDEDKIAEALNTVATELPHKGSHLEPVKQAVKVQEVLKRNHSLIAALENGTVDASDESLLNNLISSFEGVGMSGQALTNAKAFVQSVKDRRAAMETVKAALAAPLEVFDVASLSGKIDRLTAALEGAEKVNCRESDLKPVVETVETLVDQRECLRDVLHAIEAKDIKLLRGYLENAKDLGIAEGSVVVSRGKAAEIKLAAEIAQAQRELEAGQEKCLAELRTAVRGDDKTVIQKLLLKAKTELKMPEDHPEIKKAADHVEAIKAKERAAKLEQQQLVKRCIGEIRTAKRKRNIELLKAALEKASEIGVDEKSPDLVSAHELLVEMTTDQTRTKCRVELKQAIKFKDLKRLQRALKTAEAIRLVESLPEDADETVKVETAALIEQGKSLCDELLKEAERKMARNFIQTNGFGNRDWMGKAKAHGGKFVKQEKVDLQLVDVEQELWMVFTHYSVRFNAKELGVMRKDAFMALMKDCNLVSMRNTPGKVMEADMNTIHGVVSSQTKGRKFLFSSFKKAVGKIASKVYPKEKPSFAMEKLLSENVLPHAAKRVRVSIDEQLLDTDIVALERTFAPALKDIFQFFAIMPTKEEREVLHRHAARSDIDEFIGQSLTYERFMNFSSVFSLSSGTGMVHAALTNTDLAAVFLDTIRVQRVDVVGGLTFEEFWEALSRLALIFYTRRGVENRGVTSAKKAKKLGAAAAVEAADDDEEETEGESETVYETILHLLLWLNHNLDDAVPRAISSQEQFIFGRAEISLSNRGSCLQRGADLFRRKAESLEREMARKKGAALATLAASGPASTLHATDPAALNERAEMEKQLWQIFTNATVNTADPEVMRRDALMNLLRECGLVRSPTRGGRSGSTGSSGSSFGIIEADVYVIYRTFASKHPDGRFKFTCFKKALMKTAEKLYNRTGVTGRAAYTKLLNEQVFPVATKRKHIPITKQLSIRGVEELFATFSPLLKSIFMFFASPATHFEKEELHRHAPRADIEVRKQSLVFDRFCGLASTFGISSDFSTPELSSVFVDCVGVQNHDSLGGLTFEEFWAALVRLAILKCSAEGGSKALLPVPDKIIALLVSMANSADMDISNSTTGAVAARRGMAVMYANADRTSDDIARLMRAVKLFQRLAEKQRAATRGHGGDYSLVNRAGRATSDAKMTVGSAAKSKRVRDARPTAHSGRRMSQEAADHLDSLIGKSDSFRHHEKQRGVAPPKRRHNSPNPNRASLRHMRGSSRSDMLESGGEDESKDGAGMGTAARARDTLRGSDAPPPRPSSSSTASPRPARSMSKREQTERQERMQLMRMGSTYGGLRRQGKGAGKVSGAGASSSQHRSREGSASAPSTAERRKSRTAFACQAPGCREYHRYRDGFCHKHRAMACVVIDGGSAAESAPSKKKTLDASTFLMYS